MNTHLQFCVSAKRNIRSLSLIALATLALFVAIGNSGPVIAATPPQSEKANSTTTPLSGSNVIAVAKTTGVENVKTPESWTTIKDAFDTFKSIIGAVGAALGALAAFTKAGRRFVVRFALLVRDFSKEKAREKEALEELKRKLKEAPKLTEIMAKYPGRFKEQIAVGEVVTQALNQGGKLIVLASGKGGVGKSTLALGLLETWCAEGKSTLLIDFDMHNRGLTSLLGAWEHKARLTSCLEEAARFQQEMHAQLNPMLNSAVAAAKEGKTFDGQQLLEMMDQFARKSPAGGKAGPFRDFYVMPLILQDTKIGRKEKTVHKKDPWFMQSLARNESFLGSDMFEFTSNDTFFFLKFLQYWASHCPMKFDRVIVDCHGAQDLMMIGAIHAATGLIITTTPEPGAFDGTYDLLAFANLLRRDQTTRLPTILAINNCRTWQEGAAGALEEFGRQKENGALKIDDVIQLRSDDHIRRVASKYRFGTASENEELRGSCEKIVLNFERAWSTSIQSSPTADAVNNTHHVEAA